MTVRGDAAKIMHHLKDGSPAGYSEIAAALKISRNRVVGALVWLMAHGGIRRRRVNPQNIRSPFIYFKPLE